MPSELPRAKLKMKPSASSSAAAAITAGDRARRAARRAGRPSRTRASRRRGRSPATASGARVVAEQANGVVKSTGSGFHDGPPVVCEVAVQDLAAPDDPRPRVVGRDARATAGSASRARGSRAAAPATGGPGSARRRRVAVGVAGRRSSSAPAAARHCRPRAAATPSSGSPVQRVAGRAPDGEPAVERGQRQARGVGELARAALEQQTVSRDERALGGERGRVVLDEVHRVGGERVAARGAEHGEQVEARGAVEAGQREPLEHAAEAALGRPARLAGERGLLRAGALRPRLVGLDRRAGARRRRARAGTR